MDPLTLALTAIPGGSALIPFVPAINAALPGILRALGFGSPASFDWNNPGAVSGLQWAIGVVQRPGSPTWVQKHAASIIGAAIQAARSPTRQWSGQIGDEGIRVIVSAMRGNLTLSPNGGGGTTGLPPLGPTGQPVGDRGTVPTPLGPVEVGPCPEGTACNGITVLGQCLGACAPIPGYYPQAPGAGPLPPTGPAAPGRPAAPSCDVAYMNTTQRTHILLPVSCGPPEPNMRPNKSTYFLSDGTRIPKGTVWVKKRRRNPFNRKANARAGSRIAMAKRAQRYLNNFSVRDPCAAPRRRKAAKR